MRALPLMALVLASLWAPEAQAGAWTRPFGEYYVRAGYDLFAALRWEAPVGGATEAVGYQAHGFSTYGEIGLLPMHPLQLQLSVPMTYGVLQFTTAETVEGSIGQAASIRPGDLQVGLQTQLYGGPVQLSLLVETKIPMYSNDAIGERFGAWQSVFPLPGDGQIDVTPQLLLGWAGGAGFGELHVGYRFRTEAFLGFDTPITFVDSVPMTLKGGWNFGPVLWMLEAQAVVSVADDPYTRENAKIGTGILWTVWRGLAIEARVAGDVWADNTAQGVGAGLGLSWRTMP